jgi:hypothetical protein
MAFSLSVTGDTCARRLLAPTRHPLGLMVRHLPRGHLQRFRQPQPRVDYQDRCQPGDDHGVPIHTCMCARPVPHLGTRPGSPVSSRTRTAAWRLPRGHAVVSRVPCTPSVPITLTRGGAIMAARFVPERLNRLYIPRQDDNEDNDDGKDHHPHPHHLGWGRPRLPQPLIDSYPPPRCIAGLWIVHPLSPRL